MGEQGQWGKDLMSHQNSLHDACVGVGVCEKELVHRRVKSYAQWRCGV